MGVLNLGTNAPRGAGVVALGPVDVDHTGYGSMRLFAKGSAPLYPVYPQLFPLMTRNRNNEWKRGNLSHCSSCLFVMTRPWWVQD